MYKENDHSHYTVEEIKEIFQSNISNGNWHINEEEFNNLCKYLSCLPEELIAIVRDEVLIIVFSQQKHVEWDERIVFACYSNLRDEMFLKEKKGIIFLSPDFLSTDYAYIKMKKLFHEIAHHKLNHRMNELGTEAIKKKEEEADKSAYKWLQQEMHHLENI